ncbi:MAG: MFS transporter [Beijerinckiaceae bacterium]
MQPSSDLSLGRKLIDTAAMLVVAIVSMILLIYVSFGEAKRTYEKFQIEKLVAQGQVIQSSIETFVRPGLPIQQFVGFNALAEPMVKQDLLIDAISAYSMESEQVFSSGEQRGYLLQNAESIYKTADEGAEVRRTGELLQVHLPLRNRFEQVGVLVLSVPNAKIAERVQEAFKPLTIAAIVGCLSFALLVFVTSSSSSVRSRARWVAGGFAATFIITSVFVVSTLVDVYSQGAQARAKSLADSLGQRLDDLVAYNVNLDDITGIIKLFGDYKRLNPDLRSAALIVDGKVRAHPDADRRGSDWDSVPDDYEYTVTISQPDSARVVEIKVALPRNIVFKQVLRSIKNASALFVASGFFAAIFMGLARSLQNLAQSRGSNWSLREESATINLVKPVFFLAVFAEHLSYAFLPSAMQGLAAASKLSPAFAALPFVAYYAMFAISLIPSGHLERRVGPRALILGGLLLASGALAMLALRGDFWSAVAARAVAGIGQGALFIGVQAYVLANSSPDYRTRAGSSIVFGFQAGMIAGMAIGSLLVSYMDASGVFYLGAVVAIITAIYAVLVLPLTVTATEKSIALTSAARDVFRMMRDKTFARTIFLVGMPAKAVLTGVLLFGLPLLLTQQGFVKEDIGQITMIYAGAVIIASHYASARADKNKNTEAIVFQGSCMTAAGLIVMSAAGFVNWNTSNATGVILIVLGAVIVGFAHGFINAPIVTHVTHTRAADDVGMMGAAAAYRLMERIGHVIGPMIIGQLFMYFGQSWQVLGGVAIVIFIFGALFLSPGGQQTRTEDNQLA